MKLAFVNLNKWLTTAESCRIFQTAAPVPRPKLCAARQFQVTLLLRRFRLLVRIFWKLFHQSLGAKSLVNGSKIPWISHKFHILLPPGYD